MKKKHKPKNTVVSLLKQIDQHLENIAHLTSEAARSEAMLAYLDSCARFYKYSDHNLFLINLQKPDATRVAGYKKWLEFNRYVRRGEHGIAILAPCIYRLNKQPDNDDDDTIQVTELRGFRVVYVFDITQTDGDPLPPQPDWKSPARNEELQAKLIAFAAEHNITISVVKQRGAIQGRSIGGAIELDPTAGTKTLIHEIAHELLDHHNSYTDRKPMWSLRTLACPPTAPITWLFGTPIPRRSLPELPTSVKPHPRLSPVWRIVTMSTFHNDLQSAIRDAKALARSTLNDQFVILNPDTDQHPEKYVIASMMDLLTYYHFIRAQDIIAVAEAP